MPTIGTWYPAPDARVPKWRAKYKRLGISEDRISHIIRKRLQRNR